MEIGASPNTLPRNLSDKESARRTAVRTASGSIQLEGRRTDINHIFDGTERRPEFVNDPTPTIIALRRFHPVRLQRYISNELNITDTPFADQLSYSKLLKNPMFWGRSLTFFFSVILCALSMAYTVAQQSTVTLKLITKCDPKEPQQIWSHSLESADFVDGQPVLSDESQYGLHDEGCWTTKSYSINTDELWNQNNWNHHWNDPLNVDYQFVLFVVMSLFTLSVAVFTAWSMISDIIALKNGVLHTKCSKYRSSEEIRSPNQRGARSESTHQPQSRFTLIYTKIYSLYWQCLGYDSTGWIISSILSEILELSVQSQAMLMYNGLNLFDSSQVILAEKSQFIRWFAFILCLNASASGISWCSYAVIPGKCHGLKFLLVVFIVDQCCDLFYTLFPFIVVVQDSYNSNDGEHILEPLGQLHDDSHSAMGFIASFLPLFLLSTHLAIYSFYAQYELHEQYHAKWMMLEHLKPALDRLAGRQSLKHLFSAKIATPYKNWIDTKTISGRLKQIFLVMISALYFSFGIGVLVLTMRYIDDSESHCASFSESVLLSNGSFIEMDDTKLDALRLNPELFLWDHCLYKVYPFTADEQYRCQCRVFVIDWDDLESSAEDRAQFNLTQTRILEGILTHYTMLEKLMTTSADGTSSESFTFSPDMFRSVYMIAFQWAFVNINGSIPSEITKWTKIEHLAFADIESLSLPEEVGQLSELQSLSFQECGLTALPNSICNLTKLEALTVYRENWIISLPFCLDKLQNVQIIALDAMFFLENFPLSLFNLPNLKMLSLYRSAITYDSLLEYNLPPNINANDTDLVDEWMGNNFVFDNNATEYWLSSSPICDEDLTTFTQIIADFASAACVYPLDLDDDNEYVNYVCPPWQYVTALFQFVYLGVTVFYTLSWGDGKCDALCNQATLLFDGGTAFCDSSLSLSLSMLNTFVCHWDR